MPPIELPGTPPYLGGGRIFSHFTNAEGVTGITGIDANSLEVGQIVIINELQFGRGSNPFKALKAGDIFLTELGTDATVGQLMEHGIFEDKQKFVIQFSEETALVLNNIRVRPVEIFNNIFTSGRSIYTIPSGTMLRGDFLVTRIR